MGSWGVDSQGVTFSLMKPSLSGCGLGKDERCVLGPNSTSHSVPWAKSCASPGLHASSVITSAQEAVDEQKRSLCVWAGGRIWGCPLSLPLLFGSPHSGHHLLALSAEAAMPPPQGPQNLTLGARNSPREPGWEGWSRMGSCRVQGWAGSSNPPLVPGPPTVCLIINLARRPPRCWRGPLKARAG